MSARLVDPSSCRWDGIPERQHYRQWVSPSKGGPGWHVYEPPTDAQVLARMRARRTAATPVDFAALFASLPESDPDRHDFDPLDVAFAHLAPGYPDTSNPADFAASVAAGFERPVVWDDAPVCEPEFPAAPRVENVQTGGLL